jgi:hypothetical protein
MSEKEKDLMARLNEMGYRDFELNLGKIRFYRGDFE